jgi:hypothetical protein
MLNDSLQLLSDSEIIRLVEARRLLFGPYATPEVKVGDELRCNVYGLQVVAGWWGPKQWPRAKANGRPRLIVCDELRRAIESETSETVSTHWGIHICTIANWRKALGMEVKLTMAGIAFRVAKMRSYRTAHPERYIFPGYQAIASLEQRVRKEFGRRTAGARAWSHIEIEMLKHLDNNAASVELHRSIRSIGNARARYGIPHPTVRRICHSCRHEWLSYKQQMPVNCILCHRKLQK